MKKKTFFEKLTGGMHMEDDFEDESEIDNSNKTQPTSQ